jgi:hypothetical protein
VLTNSSELAWRQSRVSLCYGCDWKIFDFSRAVVTRGRRDGNNESDAERKLTIRMDGRSGSHGKAQAGERERASWVRESSRDCDRSLSVTEKWGKRDEAYEGEGERDGEGEGVGGENVGDAFHFFTQADLHHASGIFLANYLFLNSGDCDGGYARLSGGLGV